METAVDSIRQWFGEDTCDERLARIKAFWGGEGRYVVTVNSQECGYRQVFDERKILELAPRNLRHQATLPGLNLPALFADFGTVSTARHWGGKPRFDSTGGNIFIDPVAQNLDQALALAPLPVDHPDMDGPLAVRLFHALCERLDTDSLWLRTPDMQGPLNTAGLVLNQEELLIAMYTEPERVHQFLDGVTELLIRYWRFFCERTGNRVCGFIWPYTFFPCELGVSLTEDLMPLLPAELYREFGVPCLRKLGRAFGGLHLHCCGDWGRHAAALAESGERIMAAEFHYPFTRIEELERLAGATVFVPYLSLDKQTDFGSLTEYYEHLLNRTDRRHRYWFAFPGDSEEAVRFARRYGF